MRALALRPARPPLVLEDEYVRWLRRVIAGSLTEGDVYLLDLAVRLAPPAPMLEIGCFCGLATNLLQYLKRRHRRGEVLFCCDRWIFQSSEQSFPLAAGIHRIELREHAIESFERNTLRFSAGDLPHAIEATSDELFAAWRAGSRVRDLFGGEARVGGPLGFCLIDGSSAAEQVARDFEGCDEQLLPGGLILFRDSADEGATGVRRVLGEVKRSRRYEVVERNPNHLMRKLR